MAVHSYGLVTRFREAVSDRDCIISLDLLDPDDVPWSPHLSVEGDPTAMPTEKDAEAPGLSASENSPVVEEPSSSDSSSDADEHHEVYSGSYGVDGSSTVPNVTTEVSNASFTGSTPASDRPHYYAYVEEVEDEDLPRPVNLTTEQSRVVKNARQSMTAAERELVDRQAEQIHRAQVPASIYFLTEINVHHAIDPQLAPAQLMNISENDGDMESGDDEYDTLLPPTRKEIKDYLKNKRSCSECLGSLPMSDELAGLIKKVASGYKSKDKPQSSDNKRSTKKNHTNATEPIT
ncbi:hypothetical protein Hypma_012339 [Hypsizygus marmoreus]|uniref:Uncharacterized protein n=1 Tax=Hypsizygus marmoreus TaxID=39966 RepID=A0A369KEK7_HYPMA|nr:hypothetical protein Hypma_012339 [Hypsizygus marmoreus]